jgi:hypothetical protein
VHRAYRDSTRAFGLLLALLGVAMIASTVARGGGPVSLGVVLGVGFVALGGGRAYLAGRRRGP